MKNIIEWITKKKSWIIVFVFCFLLIILFLIYRNDLDLKINDLILALTLIGVFFYAYINYIMMKSTLEVSASLNFNKKIKVGNIDDNTIYSLFYKITNPSKHIIIFSMDINFRIKKAGSSDFIIKSYLFKRRIESNSRVKYEIRIQKLLEDAGYKYYDDLEEKLTDAKDYDISEFCTVKVTYWYYLNNFKSYNMGQLNQYYFINFEKMEIIEAASIIDL